MVHTSGVDSLYELLFVPVMIPLTFVTHVEFLLRNHCIMINEWTIYLVAYYLCIFIVTVLMLARNMPPALVIRSKFHSNMCWSHQLSLYV